MKSDYKTLDEALAKYKENTRRYDFEEVILPFWTGLYQTTRAFFGRQPRKYRIIDKQENNKEDWEEFLNWGW